MNSLCTTLIVVMVLLCTTGASAADDSGTFRGKWWNYYERGNASAAKNDLEIALKDLKQAIALRDRDQRTARTYGMHFIEYFPHRETGIIYFNQGELSKASNELEASLQGEESAKAAFYLNKVHKSMLLKQQTSVVPSPVLTIASPVTSSTRTPVVHVYGKAGAVGYVAAITINNVPVRFDLAQQERTFDEEVNLEEGINEITVRTADLLGKTTEAVVSVVLDREGPIVNIFEMVFEEREGKPVVRISGEIHDSSGIRRLFFNEHHILMNNQSSYVWEKVVPRGSLDKLMIRAVDALENETLAEIDLEKDLAAFNKPFEPFQIALNATQILLLDTIPPEIALNGFSEVSEVFTDKFYVEGHVLDNRRVSRVLVNGREVSSNPGKKIFFSKVVSLHEGKNSITVDAIDFSDNKATKTFVVNRTVPDIMRNSSRMSITVLPFDTVKGGDHTQLAYDHLIGAFVDQKRFSIIERAKLEQVLREQKLSAAKLTDPENSVRVGKLLSADTILSTTVKENAESIELVSRVISAETSEVLEVKDVYTEDKGAGSIRDLTAGLASKIAASFPLAQGMVIKSGKKELYADLGDTAKIKKNTAVILFRKGKELKHPVTGKSLGWDTEKLGEGRIEEIEKDYSKIRLLDKPGAKEVRVKDLIITK